MRQNPGEGSKSLCHTAFQEGLCRLQLTNGGRIGKERKKKVLVGRSSTCGDVEGRKITKPLRNCRFDEDGES